MRISVIGCGYLGAVHAASLAKLGHQVIGVDVDPVRLAALEAGRAPFFEPGFDTLLAEVSATGRLRFTGSMAEIADCELHFLCVGTPQKPGSGEADLSYVDAAVRALRDILASPDIASAVVAGKSTVPVGTAERLADFFADSGANVALVWNPEFLREGFAVQDTLEPDRIVYGLAPGEAGRRGAAALDEAYAPILHRGTPKIETDWATAELVKVAANSFLATKISFINAMSEVCDATGGDVLALARAIGLDERIGPKFLRAGVGFGGGCLPKDIRAFAARATALGASGVAALLTPVDAVNRRARDRMVDLIAESVGWVVSPGSVGQSQSAEGNHPSEAGLQPESNPPRLAVLGAAFKPDSDDTRDSPALDVARRLAALGADVHVYDPAAGSIVSRLTPELTVAQSLSEAAEGAQALIVLTEWREFIDLDPDSVTPLVARRVMIDGRSALPAARWRDAGWDFRGPGRP
ncbi:MAG: UDP-glucose/GDP-mannose dehydrogenase family protein [Propionibacteriaceae bacterium]|nr:UDP-glucose/GDP-mannose dehydrogenase family protein [Propionibacteriaceae bacterium]